MADELILHQYDVSPYTRKVKMALAVKGLAWRACTQPVIAPKPDLVALTGGYRRIPVLQIGADIYCDSDLILRVLDRLYPDPPLGSAGDDALAFALSPWLSAQLTSVAVPLSFSNGRAVDPAFARDREQVMGGPFVDVERWRNEAPHAAETLRAQFGWIDAMLADGRSWLTGDRPRLLDMFAYPNLGFLREMGANLDMIEQSPRFTAWEERARALGDGRRSEITTGEAVEIARRARPAPFGGLAAGEPNGLALGDEVVVRAADYGRDPVRGTLVSASAQHVTVRRVDERTGEVAVHFPRVGFTVERIQP
jgi:glutathione S-transferase